jgi:hypothetical protein
MGLLYEQSGLVAEEKPEGADKSDGGHPLEKIATRLLLIVSVEDVIVHSSFVICYLVPERGDLFHCKDTYFFGDGKERRQKKSRAVRD